MRFRQPLPREQAEMGTGILTVSYPGNERTRVRIARSSYKRGSVTGVGCSTTLFPPTVVQQIADRDGTLHSYTLFTGYLPARMRGEMQAYQVLGAP